MAGESHLGDELEPVAAGERAIGVEPNGEVDALGVVAVPLDGTAEPALMSFLDGALESGVFPPDLIGVGRAGEDVVHVKQQHIPRRCARERALEELRLVVDVADGVAEHQVHAPSM
jgi:hypothetical protein